ncbi:hypothetical protein [Streptomyces coeruleorubidus]|uniref:hypothetical protein n=1 Tax=Streptomyces coeruleorubidus TaxID=116188 RepID=UPI003790CA3A
MFALPPPPEPLREGRAADTEPDETGPGWTEPDEPEPEDTEPDEAEPGEAEPGDTEPDEAEPGDTEPDETEPGDTEPDETEVPCAGPDGRAPGRVRRDACGGGAADSPAAPFGAPASGVPSRGPSAPSGRSARSSSGPPPVWVGCGAAAARVTPRTRPVGAVGSRA